MFGKALLKRFQPQLGIYLQDSKSEEQENRRGDDALEIKNHNSKESKSLEGAEKRINNRNNRRNKGRKRDSR